VKSGTVARNWPAVLAGSLAAGLAAANVARPSSLALSLAACIGCTLALVGRDGALRLVAMALALLCAGAWWGGLRLDAMARSPLTAELGRTAVADVVVTGPPRVTPFAVRAPGQVRRWDGETLRERVLLQLRGERAPPQGAVLRLRARLVAPRRPETGFDERAWLARQGISVVLVAEGWRIVGRRGGIGGAADGLRAEISRVLASGTTGERRALLLGIVLGADEGIDQHMRQAFRRSGLAHILAVSGQNVAILVIGIVWLASALGIGKAWGHAAAIVAVLAYALAVGWQPSVVRAAVAGCLASLAWLAARPGDRWHFLALGAVVLLAWSPAAARDPGAQLSFAAVGAIFLLTPRLVSSLEGYPLPRQVREGLALAIPCSVVTAPVLWLHFGVIPVWGVAANLLAEPAVLPLLWTSFAAAAVGPVVPSAGAALAWIAGWCAWWIGLCARVVAALPFAQVSGTTALVLGAVALAGAAVARTVPPGARGRAVGWSAAALALGWLAWWALRPIPRWHPPAGLRVSFLDVGQGDSALLEVPQGAVLVDEGPPEADVAGQLRRLGIRSLAAIVLTHPQRDHVGGAADVLRELRVSSVLDPSLPSESSDERAALAAARSRHVPVLTVRAGQRYRLGKLELRVLWPDRAGPASEDPNLRAVVLLATYGAVDVLLTADAESDVTGRFPLRSVDVLKVAHHGSEDRGLGSELRRWHPRIAVISVGAHNDYGHPRAETLQALRGAPGLAVYRTDENGRVVVETQGRVLTVRTERGVP
jgi:competence protein ComEC